MVDSNDPIKKRLEHDENFILKVLSEVGDLARLIRGLIARIDKLEKKVNKICKDS